MTKQVAATRKRAKLAGSAGAEPAVKPTQPPPAEAAAKAARSRSESAASKKAPAAKAAASAAPLDQAPKPAAKAKLVRDSFTIPKAEYEHLAELKRRALSLGVAAKKSELLRAGIAAMNAMNDRAFVSAVQAIPSLKTGRPKAPSA